MRWTGFNRYDAKSILSFNSSCFDCAPQIGIKKVFSVNARNQISNGGLSDQIVSQLVDKTHVDSGKADNRIGYLEK